MDISSVELATEKFIVTYKMTYIEINNDGYQWSWVIKFALFMLQSFQSTRYTKMEKADILEMTVQFLKCTQQGGKYFVESGEEKECLSLRKTIAVKYE